ncbi:DUF4214 domain-containing protein [Aquihabitans sp. McL0605]|uniref:DUF4214 domain-containing protein n=1 Tax=Aquihabitans sp. McL0605 TaxID=3415671 RepID=UPI003CEFBB42
MPGPSTDTTERIRRRRRRILASIPFGLTAWVVMTGLPFAPAGATPGTMHTEIVTLSGPKAERTAAATPASRVAAAPAAATDSTLRSAPTTAGPAWSASIDVEDGTQSVAASWTGAPEGSVSVRGHDDDGWTDWTELAADPDDGPDDGVRDAGGMAWFSSTGVDTVEVKVNKGELSDLQVQPMRYQAPSGHSLVTAAIAGASAKQPEIIPRTTYTSKGWATGNSGCASGPISASGGVKFAVVHHTVNSNTYAATDVPALLASIYAYHTGTNGWCDTAYNFIVDRFGRIWEGRSGGVTKPIVGGHAQGFNTGSVGVSFLGQFEPGASPTAAQPSSAALSAAAQVIGWKLGLYGIDPTGTVSVTSGGSNKWPAGTVLTLNRIIGHRDVGYTACPGANLYSQLPAVRTAAKAAQGTATVTTTTTAAPTTTTTTPPPASDFAPFANATQLVTQQYRDVLFRDPKAADLSYWTPRAGTTWTPGRFIANMEAEPETDTRVHAVTRLYFAYFLRKPDHSGFTYWMARRGEGHSLNSISQQFALSSEFKKRYGTLTNSAFVDQVYTNVLGRQPDASGRSYWTARLNGGMPRGTVMTNFSESTEFRRGTADATQIVSLYESLLKRAATPNIYATLQTEMSAGTTTVSSLAAHLYDSDEYRSRFK